ncbi:hypothetical protein P0082_08690 [Candidatus Haliotispira prima]|uniref:Tetratricopeptide repeat protein n=1 Tax=Candidatus Haliotispira prima TaxID=3034016 RepID=A0ABY8MF06_9SPIO|nr:hypothetical protein P0082_08690 [Candidatus Haliotispira prima]
MFLDNADYFYLLGRSYFTAGDMENAKLYLKRGLENNPNHEDIQLMQACFAIKERDTYHAISVWLRLENAGCRRACLRYGLDQIRRINDTEELYNFTRSPKFARLFPSLPGIMLYHFARMLSRVILMVSLIGIIWLGYSVGTPKFQQVYKDWRNKREQSGSISLAGLDSDEYFSFEKKDVQFTFTEKELNTLTGRIRRDYDLYNDNLVQRDINRIFLSNAGDKVKAKFRLIEDLLSDQQEVYDLKDNFDFQEVRKNPQLYRNCYISWHGKPTNIRIDKKGRLRFVLLVGYTDGTVFEGQTLVLLGDLISVPTDQPLTVFGRVKILDLAAQEREKAEVKAEGIEQENEKTKDRTESEVGLAEEGTGGGGPATFYIEAKTLARS